MNDTTLKPRQKQCEKVLRSYYTLPLTIERMKTNAEVATTASYATREGQSHAAPSSPIEEVAMKRNEIRLKETELKLLERLRNTIHEDLVDIWEMRYNPKYQYNNQQTILQLNMERKTYYRLVAQLLGHVADVFGLWEEVSHE